MNTGPEGRPWPAPPDRPQAPPRRRVWVWCGIVGLTVVGLIAAASVRARISAPALQGGIVSPPAPTYDFTLHDQDDRPVRLGTLRGKAVVLTFLYTHCPDACPLTAERLHAAYDQLGPATSRVVLLAVSVDPKGDTPAAVRAFLAAHHVGGELRYLTGSFPELKRVWAYYYVQSDAKPGRPAAARGRTAPAGADLVGHTSIVYLIDRSGNLRVFLPGNFEAKDLATDLKILANEPNRPQT